MPTFYMIDPPSPFDATAEWQAFLSEMAKLAQDNEQVAAAIREAREMLAERAPR